MSGTTEAVGHNRLRADDYLTAMRDIMADEIVKNAAVGRIRSVLKRLKDAGENTDAIAMLRRLARLSEDDRSARMAALFRLAGWEGIKLVPGVDPAATQQELWEDPSPPVIEAHRDAVIHMDGYNTCRSHGARDENPKQAGSRDYQTWDAGWLDCERELLARGGAPRAAVKTASVERKPRKVAEGALAH